jgi:pimeloyl-ACP methyl ester carboxylesterase
MYYKTSDNLNLYYEIHGNLKSKKHLIFLNGITQSSIAWNLVLPSFISDYQIIVCDFIFQGKSDKKGDARNFDQHAADIYGLLGFLNISKINLVGLSYGSLVAQHFALNHPEKVKKLFLISSFAHQTPYLEAMSYAWGRALDIGGYSLMFDIMLPVVLSEGYFDNPLISPEALKVARENINTEPAALKKLMQATYERGDYREKLRAIKNPTLVIHGEKDSLLPVHMAKAVADAIEGSKFEIIPNAGHTLNLEAISQTVKLIKEFI